jgi:copper resistance protein B
MPKALHIRALILVLVALMTAAAQAQEGVDHSQHHGTAAAQEPESTATQPAAAPNPHASHDVSGDTKIDAPTMGHGDMNMSSDSASADVRDPNAYSDGLQLGSGDYAVPGVPRLALSDEHWFALLRADTLERRFTQDGEDDTAYDLQAWYGTTYDRAVLKAEGDIESGKLEESRTELLWGHAVASYWDTQLGVRMDNGEGSSRQWLAFGVQGLAPYWFETQVTTYVGNGGRISLRLEGSYEMLLTQRLILEPRAEVQFYNKDDPQETVGNSCDEVSAGLRLRYEFSRQLAPYIGVERAGSFGQAADDVRATGGHAQQTFWVAGVRFWL